MNVAEKGAWKTMQKCRQVLSGNYDAIVMLHSVFSNCRMLKGMLFESVALSNRPKVYFIGNEYKLMPDKMKFCDRLGVDLLISQSDSPAVHNLYRQRLRCKVASIPNTGLDTAQFYPQTPLKERTVDIGYRAYDAPKYLGHNERREIAEYFLEHAPKWGLITDISTDPTRRFKEQEWAAFLNRCRGQIGTEAGGDFFELTDSSRLKVNAYEKAHPDASMAEISELFFKDYPNPLPLRIISGRQVEAAATKTVQILFEGNYNGYLQPNVHYISLKKDFSNIDDVMRRFRDQAYCHDIAENAYQLVVGEFTYEKLADKLLANLKEIL